MQGIAPSYQAQYDGVPLDPPPSPRQGFGRLNLGNTLLLAGATSRLRVRGCLSPPLCLFCALSLPLSISSLHYAYGFWASHWPLGKAHASLSDSPKA